MAISVSLSVEEIRQFVPAHILNWVEKNAEPTEDAEREKFEAAVIFADISGFSKLTERLTKDNPKGVEELAGILNIYIGKLIDIIVARGGDIIKFAGDALFAIWPSTQEENLAICTHRAVRTSMYIQEKLHNLKVTSGISLSLKIGVGTGELHSLHVGGLFERWELLLAGRSMNQVNAAGELAKPGQVVISKQVANIIEGMDGGNKTKHARFRMKDLLISRFSRPLVNPQVGDKARNILMGYIPRAILSRLDQGLDPWEADMRTVTVFFLNVKSLKYNSKTPLDEVQKIMVLMQDCIYKEFGSINRFGIDDKGAVLLAAFGLPPMEAKHDAVNAVNAATALRKKLKEVGHNPLIGITTGRIFCGSVGNDIRCEYTMHGTSVNFAARLMQHSSSILCDEATYRAASSQIEFEALTPILVKGKTKETPVFKPV